MEEFDAESWPANRRFADAKKKQKEGEMAPDRSLRTSVVRSE